MDNDDLKSTPADFGFQGVTSRYTDIEGVVIDSEKVPERFRHLIPLAKYWCIGDDAERADLMSLTRYQELAALVLAFRPFFNEIGAWCSRHHHDVPVPDEVVVFDMALEAVAEAEACHVDTEN